MLAEIGSVDLRVSSYGSYTTLDKSAFREKRLSVGLERRSGRIAPNKSVYRPQSTSLARLPDESPRLEPGIQCEPPPSTRPPEFLANHPSKRLLQRFPRLRNVSPKRIVDQALTIPPPPSLHTPGTSQLQPHPAGLRKIIFVLHVSPRIAVVPEA